MEYTLKEKLEAEQFTSANYENVEKLLKKNNVDHYERNIRNAELIIWYKTKSHGLVMHVQAHNGDYITFYRGDIWIFKKEVFEKDFKKLEDK